MRHQTGRPKTPRPGPAPLAQDANPADVADQRQPARPDLEPPEVELDDALDWEAEPADLADQRREVPVLEDPEV